MWRFNRQSTSHPELSFPMLPPKAMGTFIIGLIYEAS